MTGTAASVRRRGDDLGAQLTELLEYFDTGGRAYPRGPRGGGIAA